jgi:hypothetical protein
VAAGFGPTSPRASTPPGMRYRGLCRAAGLQRLAGPARPGLRQPRPRGLPLEPPRLRWLLETLGALGFVARERFYAGAEAGGGAQVVEHPGTGDAFFLDVDLAPDEVDVDFSATPLKETERLGTIGLWCALHGDSLFEGGFHHLACRASFEDLSALFEADGVGMMKPFAERPHLRQAFTKGEHRLVAAAHRRARGAAGSRRSRWSSSRTKGALGPRQVIERNAGFRGFGVTEVSAIIRDTDQEGRLLRRVPPLHPGVMDWAVTFTAPLKNGR